MVNYKIIGNRIKNKRKKAAKTQEQLAAMLDVSEGYISQVERGATKISLDTLGTIAEYLDADIGEFITGAAYETPNYLSYEMNEIYNKLTSKEKELLLSIAGSIFKSR